MLLLLWWEGNSFCALCCNKGEILQWPCVFNVIRSLHRHVGEATTMLHIPCLKWALSTGVFALRLCIFCYWAGRGEMQFLLFKEALKCVYKKSPHNLLFGDSPRMNFSICSCQQWKSQSAQTFRRRKSRSHVSRDRSYVYFIRYTTQQ